MNANALMVMPMSELEKMANVVVKSRLFGVESIEQAMTLMLLAQAEGVHPAIAMRDYHIVEGKPALKADAMLARFQAGGGKVEWEEYTDTKVSARFSHPNSPKPVLIEWSMESASKVSVYNKKKQGWEPITSRHTWKSYPRQMLKARVISEGVRATNPGVSVGIYTPEEVADENRSEKDITPSGPITPTTGVMSELPIAKQEVVMETAQQIKACIANDQLSDAYSLWSANGFDADEQVALASLLDSKQRGILTRMAAEERAHADGRISPQAKKRLEARINELHVKREDVKQFCQDNFQKEHFSDLSRQEYETLDAMLTNMALVHTEPAPPQADSPAAEVIPPHAVGADHKAAADGNGSPSGEYSTEHQSSPHAPSLISREQVLELESLLEQHRLKVRFGGQLAINKIKTVAEIPTARYHHFMNWIQKQCAAQEKK